MRRDAVRAAFALLIFGMLAACASRPPVRVATEPEMRQAQRSAALALRPDWQLEGKIAVSDGRDGGSGRLVWSQQGDAFEIEVSAPVSRRSWRLIGDARGARIEGLDGGTRYGSDASALLEQAVGWVVPVDHMSAWARGLAGRGPSKLEYGADALPRTLEQSGWTVDYRAWSTTTPDLPQKVFAHSGDRRVRIVVQRWTLGAPRE